MNMIASAKQTQVEAPTAPCKRTEPRLVWSRPSQPIEVPKQAKKGDVAERRAQHGNGTAWQPDERGLGWTVDTSRGGQETKTTREILDLIDAGTLRAAQIKGETSPQIETNRDRIAALLGLCEEWKRPDEVYADEAWEISVVWRSGYGRVEIGTEEDGGIGYYVSRTLNGKNKEGNLQEHSSEELGRVMSWLGKAPKEL